MESRKFVLRAVIHHSVVTIKNDISPSGSSSFVMLSLASFSVCGSNRECERRRFFFFFFFYCTHLLPDLHREVSRE